MNDMRVLACHVLSDELLQVMPEGTRYEFLEYSLHRTPEELKRQLSRRIQEDTSTGCLALAYGLCSNGVAGITSPRHTIVIPNAHDCISLLLGDARRYLKEFSERPGTYYLSKGWIEHGGDPLSEYYRYEEKYGRQDALWVMEELYKNYRRLVFIDTGLPDLMPYRRHAQEAARFLKLEYEEVKGSASLLQRLVRQDWNEDFLVFRPGERISQVAFLACQRDIEMKGRG
ncbi:MAG: DUF1638 domain-containing protein [Bacillota bacterium]